MLRVWASRHDDSVSPVCDIDAARAEQVAALSGAQVFSGWRNGRTMPAAE